MDKTSQISLKQLLTLVKRGIEAAHPFAYWVVAEISEVKVNYSGHCYMELIEKQQGATSPVASARAVIWRSKYAMIDPYFRSVAGGPITAGMKVLVKATVQYSEIYGFSLQISDIDPTYTIGDNERQKQETIAKLKAEGVYDMNRECILPEFVGRLAVISSKNAAGFEDFMRELDSAWNFEVSVFEATVQGSGAEDSIIRALEAIADDMDSFDAVILIRGGGSSSDLGCFDSYRLCYYLAQFPLPVITGIGHNKDVSIADMVACLSLKTPTAVAVFLKDSAQQAFQLVEGLQSQISALTSAIIDGQKQRILSGSNALNLSVNQSIAASRSVLQRYSSSVSVAAVAQTQRLGARLENYKQTLKNNAEGVIAAKRSGIENRGVEIGLSSKEALAKQKLKIANFEQLISAHNPQRLLEIGFAVVRSEQRALRSIKGHKAGDILEISLADATVKTEIKEIWKSKQKSSATIKQ